MAAYAPAITDRVNKLLLYAPQWIAPRLGSSRPAGRSAAYRVVQRMRRKRRWLTGVRRLRSRADSSRLVPKAWAAATFSSDPWGVNRTRKNARRRTAPSRTRANTGAQASVLEPETIRVPTLLLVGEWDQDTPALHGAGHCLRSSSTRPTSELVPDREATHTVLMEKNRMQLFRAVQAFSISRRAP